MRVYIRYNTNEPNTYGPKYCKTYCLTPNSRVLLNWTIFRMYCVDVLKPATKNLVLLGANNVSVGFVG